RFVAHHRHRLGQSLADIHRLRRPARQHDQRRLVFRHDRAVATTYNPPVTLTNRDHYPVVVLGTGIAGLTAAFCLASAGVRVLLVTKAKDPKDCNTFWAQGGIIYQGEGDSPAKLIEDVLQAGAGLSNEEAVRFLAVEGPRVVRELLLEDVQVPFSTT